MNCHVEVNILNQKTFTKLSVDLYGAVRIKTFYNRIVNKGNNIPNNQYTQLTVILVDYHKHFQFKVVFGEHI